MRRGARAPPGPPLQLAAPVPPSSPLLPIRPPRMAPGPAPCTQDALALVAVRNAEAGNESEVIAAADRKGRSG